MIHILLINWLWSVKLLLCLPIYGGLESSYQWFWSHFKKWNTVFFLIIMTQITPKYLKQVLCFTHNQRAYYCIIHVFVDIWACDVYVYVAKNSTTKKSKIKFLEHNRKVVDILCYLHVKMQFCISPLFTLFTGMQKSLTVALRHASTVLPEKTLNYKIKLTFYSSKNSTDLWILKSPSVQVLFQPTDPHLLYRAQTK